MWSVTAPTTDVIMSADSSGREEELKATKRKISLSTCALCGAEEAKYTCPACLSHSCSLLCVKKHKEMSGCSGVRNKTAFVTLSHFDEMTLLSDYRLLEDAGRFADGTTRDRLIRTPRSTFKAKRLAAFARKMNMTLRFLPITFTKSRENSTVFITKEKMFLWHLKLIFPQSSAEFSQRRVFDRQTLEQILTPYIHPAESDPVKCQKLKMYVQTPFDHVKIFMKAEGRKANSLRYHELDIHKTLRDNLSYKTLIEYPVLHVVLKDHWKEYPLKGQAEPASTCNSFATTKIGVHKEEGVVRLSPSLQGDSTPRGTNIWTGTPETSPETESPQVKRAKRDLKKEEMEEGEIEDSSGEEKEEGNAPESGDGAKSPANDLEVIKDKPADSDSINKHSDSSRDQCINEDVSGSTDPMTIELSEKSRGQRDGGGCCSYPSLSGCK